MHSILDIEVVDRIARQMEFCRAWATKPKTIGAIAPTSATMARKMASVISPDSGLPVLELGPGNGSITRSILARGVSPGDLVSVEYAETFLPGLRLRFPGVNFVHGDAFDISQIARNLGIRKFDSIISALPLLNFSLLKRFRFIRTMLEFLEPGKPLVQFSYGRKAPVPPQSEHFRVTHLDTVLLNLPPARLWIYQRNT